MTRSNRKFHYTNRGIIAGRVAIPAPPQMMFTAPAFRQSWRTLRLGSPSTERIRANGYSIFKVQRENVNTPLLLRTVRGVLGNDFLKEIKYFHIGKARRDKSLRAFAVLFAITFFSAVPEARFFAPR